MIIDRAKEKKTLYTAYGYTVEGIKADYVWTYDGSNRREDCLTSLYITDADGKEVYIHHGFNNPIFMECFNRNIDCFLWWIAADQPDAYTLEKNFHDVFLKNSCFFSHRINQRKQAEKRKEEERQKALEREKIEAEISGYCAENNLKLYKTFSRLYIMEFSDDRIETLFNNADADRLENYINFITENGTNDAKIVFSADTYHTDIKPVFEAIKALKTA